MRLATLGILSAATALAQDWTSYGKDSFGSRYSELDQINTKTVARLTPQWMYQTNVPGKNETTPLVFGGMMFVTGLPVSFS